MAQLVVAGAVFLATAGMRDDHGIGFAGGVLAQAPQVLLLVVLAGYLHWLLFSLPAMVLERLVGNPRWAAASSALGAAAVSAAYAWGAVSLWGAPFGWAVAWVAGVGALPVTAAWYARHRLLRWGAMAARIGALTGIALLLALVGGFLQERTRWHAYEPPRLDRSRYVGQWIGAGGAYSLRLDENGEAEAGNLALVHGNARLWDNCSGTGTWTFESQRGAGRPAAGGRGTGSPSRSRAAARCATGRWPARSPGRSCSSSRATPTPAGSPPCTVPSRGPPFARTGEPLPRRDPYGGQPPETSASWPPARSTRSTPSSRRTRMLGTDFRLGSPVWLDLGSPDTDAAAAFYSAVFGWQFVSAGPEAGGYGFFQVNGKTVAALGPLTEEGRVPPG